MSTELAIPPYEIATNASPFDILLDYEQRAQAHVAGAAEQVEAPGLWRGIGFRIGTQHLVSGIGEVNEILTMPAMTVIPGTKPWMLGVANIRGNLIAIVDLRNFIEGARTPIGDKSRVLVARQPGGAVGVLVDEVLGQRNFTDENIPVENVDVDERYARFIARSYELGSSVWSIFSMTTLVRSPDFLQAAA
ncbi:MAG TPA: chemotaxis protein CheW [Xanthomonadales bacterium]|nr:chemotaxis protein CheW [Xanthomonadales bacterium]